MVVDNIIQKNLVNKYKDNEMNSLEMSIRSKKFDNIVAATTMPYNNHSTAVTRLIGRSSSIQKRDEYCRFYSLSNSIAKINFEKHNTLNGTFAQINNMPTIMRSILEKSQLGTTFVSPKRIMQKHFSSNLTTIQNIDKVVRSYSVMNCKNMADTKILGGGHAFEDIDEAQSSDSKQTTSKNLLENRDQFNTSFERDIINISEIKEAKEKWTKKRILENISFDTTQYDIYNPD
jgi:hypothetical protein